MRARTLTAWEVRSLGDGRSHAVKGGLFAHGYSILYLPDGVSSADLVSNTRMLAYVLSRCPLMYCTLYVGLSMRRSSPSSLTFTSHLRLYVQQCTLYVELSSFEAHWHPFPSPLYPSIHTTHRPLNFQNSLTFASPRRLTPYFIPAVRPPPQ